MENEQQAKHTNVAPVIRAIFPDASEEELLHAEKRIKAFLLRAYLVYEDEIEEACRSPLDNC